MYRVHTDYLEPAADRIAQTNKFKVLTFTYEKRMKCLGVKERGGKRIRMEMKIGNEL